MDSIKKKDDHKGGPDPSDRGQGTVQSIRNTPSTGSDTTLTGTIKSKVDGSYYQFADPCFYATYRGLSDEEIIGMECYFSTREFPVAGTCPGGVTKIWIATELSPNP
jgi:hypothetical protein